MSKRLDEVLRVIDEGLEGTERKQAVRQILRSSPVCLACEGFISRKHICEEDYV